MTPAPPPEHGSEPPPILHDDGRRIGAGGQRMPMRAATVATP
jgi:hypothetical protein